MPNYPEQVALRNNWAKINSSISDIANLEHFGNLLVEQGFLPTQTVTSCLRVTGDDPLTKVGKLMSGVRVHIVNTGSADKVAENYKKFVVLVHDDLQLTALAKLMDETCKECYGMMRTNLHC